MGTLGEGPLEIRFKGPVSGCWPMGLSGSLLLPLLNMGVFSAAGPAVGMNVPC